MERIIKYFTDNDLYKFTMACAIVNSYPDAVVTYRFQDRNNTVYPYGFANLVKEQLQYLSELRITDAEIEYMKEKCYYLPEWFFTYLRGVQMDPNAFNVSQDNAGHLSLEFTGKWSIYVLYEVQILAIISRLYYMMTKDIDVESDPNKFLEYYDATYSKATKMLEAGCSFAEFGTRRRFAYWTQNAAVMACNTAYRDYINNNPDGKGKFLGTSNVYLAMKYKLTPIGTMAHEFISGVAGILGSPIEANHIAMREWEKTYNGALGIFLYDTFGFDMFAQNFSDKYARSFDGLRVDSGDNYEQYDKICGLYREHRVDPSTKNIMFSNALTTDEFIELNRYVESKGGKCGAGIGTHLTNDMQAWGIEPMNIVIKLVFISVTERRLLLPTGKFSNTPGKYIVGDERIAKLWQAPIELAHQKSP